MPVRSTERQFPAGLAPSDLGQSKTGPDGRASLVSFNTTPIVQHRFQAYVVFVTDGTLAGQVSGYHWSVESNGGSLSAETDVGYFELRPEWRGSTTVRVTLKGPSDEPVLELRQHVGAPDAVLEVLYEQTTELAPLAGHPETSREVINDLRPHLVELALAGGELNLSLMRIITAITYAEVQRRPVEPRNAVLEAVAAALEAQDASSFVRKGRLGLGCCGIRPHVLAMYVPETPNGTDWYLSRREYPVEETARCALDRTLLEELAALEQAKQVDLFNLLRFPRANLRAAIRLLQVLREQYANDTSFDDLVSDPAKSDQLKSLLDQFKHGPTRS